MGEILRCDHSNESYTQQFIPVVLFIVLYTERGSYFNMALFIMPYKVVSIDP